MADRGYKQPENGEVNAAARLEAKDTKAKRENDAENMSEEQLIKARAKEKGALGTSPTRW